MIVITTPAGQIGRQVLGNLLDSGEQLRVIARDPSRLPAEVREDLDIVEGSHGDAAVTCRPEIPLNPTPDGLRWMVGMGPAQGMLGEMAQPQHASKDGGG